MDISKIDLTKILTWEETQALMEKIARGLEENHITGSNNVIGFAMKEAWVAGFEGGYKYRSESDAAQ